MSKLPTRNRFQRCILKEDYPPPTVDLEPLSTYKKRVLPWRFIPADDWQDALTLVSGDGTHDAVVYMDGGKVTAQIRRLYVDRISRQAFIGTADDVRTIPSRSLQDRAVQLFKEYPREWLSALAHQHWGDHSEYCTPECNLYAPTVGRVQVGQADPKEPFEYYGYAEQD